MHLFDGKDLDAIERFPKAERIGVGDISKFHGAILAGVVVPGAVGPTISWWFQAVSARSSVSFSVGVA